MSSKQNQTWPSSVSLTKIFSRITRTLSFSSKKNKKIVQHSQSVDKNMPKSVPVIRRHPPQSISKVLYNDDIMQTNHHRQGVHINIPDESDDEKEDDSRYSLQPNLSPFNISMDNLHSQQVPQSG